MAQESTDPLRIYHWSLLVFRFPLYVLSCVTVTIKDFVFSSVFRVCFSSYIFGRLSRYDFLAKYGRSSNYLRNVPSHFEFLKFDILEHPDPPSHNEFTINVTNVLFSLVGGFGCGNPAEWPKYLTDYLHINNLPKQAMFSLHHYRVRIQSQWNSYGQKWH